MEKAYFPMETCNITQGYGSKSYSHKNCKALDLSGKDSGIEPAYAPFSGTIKKIYTKDANEVWIESKDKVLCADGKERLLVMMLVHADTVNLKVGQKVKQGEKFYQEGTRGKTTGNHIHMEVGEGPFTGSGWSQVNGSWTINKPLAPEKILWFRNSIKIKNTKYQKTDYVMKIEGVDVINYYPKTKYSGVSIVDALKLINVDSSYSNRVKIAKKK